MKIIIWGSRGSLPASITAKEIKNKIQNALKAACRYGLTSKDNIENFIETLPFSVKACYGTNTSCVEIRNEDEYILFDAGTGLRDFGNYIIKSGVQPCHFHIFLSHLHWDHIQGFPFFVPAFIPGNCIDIYGFHKNIKQAFINQQEAPCFPLPLKFMQADIKFNLLELGKEYKIAGFKIKGIEQNHPGKSYGYSCEKAGKKIMYSTDSEYKQDPIAKGSLFIDFFKNADLLIFDAQYSLSDSLFEKQDWGHSSNLIAVELAIEAGVKHLCMFHNEPTHNDEVFDKILKNTKQYASIYNDSYPLEISLAFDGLEIDI
ncbi:Beta-lactamase domain-containing protein [Candidatus Magnetomoraceae bacterium gMMP-15]